MAAQKPYIQEQGAIPQDAQPYLQPQQTVNHTAQPDVTITRPTAIPWENATKTYNVKSALTLGSLQLVSGILSIFLAVGHVCIISPGNSYRKTYIPSTWIFIIGTGIWCGVLVSLVVEVCISVVCMLFGFIMAQLIC